MISNMVKVGGQFQVSVEVWRRENDSLPIMINAGESRMTEDDRELSSHF